MVTARLRSPGRLGLERPGRRVLLATARLPAGALAFRANLGRWARSAAGRTAGLFAVIAATYVVGAELAWHHFSSGLAFGYPPSGVDVAALLLIARRRWPVVIAAIAICEVGVDLQHHLTLAVALGAALANVVEPVTGASFVRWFCSGRQPDLGTRLGLGRFLLGAVVLGPVVGGLIGATVSWASKGGWWPGLVLQWWAGDGIAVLVIGGTVLLWAQRRELVSSRWLELVLVILLATGLSVVAFRFGELSGLPFLPVLAWAALRLRDLGVVLTGAAFAAVANYMTAAGYGEFAHLGLSSPASVAVTQAYIAVVVLVGWVLAQEVAGRMSAVQDRDSARLERAMAEARREAAELGAVLADAATVNCVGDQVSAAVRARLDAAHVVISMLAVDGRRFEPLASSDAAAQVAVMSTDWTIDSDAPGPRAVRDRIPVYPADLKAPDVSIGSAAALPLLTEVGALGCLGVWWAGPHEVTAVEREYLRSMAETTSRALERARLREAERREHARVQALAAVLQRAVMPTTAAAIPGLEIGASYRQAGTAQQIGGDWYDAMALPGKRAYLAVGDVVGHGLTAAEDMTQLRNAGRTLAILGGQPAGILDELARVTDWATSGKFATVAAAIIELDVSLVTYATAGHPPILIRRAKTGTVEIPPPAEGPALCLPGGQGLPQYPQGQTGFGVGDIMLMYTDGLIERRGEDLTEGITRVAERLQAWQPGAPLGGLCDELIASLAAEPQLDDMCVLAVTRLGPGRGALGRAR
jgi:serine phosphatase RsbU (regulator of sigma subunit)/integral membrane sensor domain MASE1